ncbi:MAG: type II toxin-antitoxin system RelE/ParE family toxin [Firmicutes bacterium HGW-Firmicutes-7]|nr:MAG: type II toxin-antitoxin system RelE/ParE family toxin [Firmicutes bacterium HGW-Firmicutes-7]
MYELIYYAEKNKIPVLDFLKSLNPKEQAKILREIDLLEEFGFSLGSPHIKKMVGTDSLWELRIKQSTNNFRIFYFNYINNKFILLHAIRKASQKTPKKDINLALTRQANYIKGCEHNES